MICQKTIVQQNFKLKSGVALVISNAKTSPCPRHTLNHQFAQQPIHPSPSLSPEFFPALQ